MGRLLASVFGLRPEERTLAFLMAVYHVLLLVSLYLLKPVRDSLFLSTRGPAELPFVFILTTVVVIPVAFFHARAGRKMDVGPLIDGMSLVLVVSIVGLRGLLYVGGAWVSYILYAWVSIYGLVVTSQFWLLANALFTDSQSKRVFTLLSAGAIVGAILGGEVTGVLVDTIGLSSESLLWGAGGVLLASTGLGRGIRTYYRRDERHADGSSVSEQVDVGRASGALPIIKESRHIQLIVALLILTVVVTTLVDYQFKTVAARAFPEEAALTTFLGHFYGRVSIVALLVQLVLAPRLMRIVGIGGALSVLPGILALGSVGMLVVPGLVAGVFLRGAGQSLKHSVDKTGRELLYVPIALEKKKRVKVFVDLFVDQGAQGVGGLLLLALAFGAGLSVQMLSGVVLVLIGAWGVIAYRARHTYVDQYRAKLRARHADEAIQETEEDGAVREIDELLDALCSHVETDAIRALDELEEGTVPVPVDAVLCLLDHPSDFVREQALRVLRVREVADVGDDVAEALRDPDPDVQLEAARYLYCQLTDNHLERLNEALDHEDPQIQSAAVGLIAEEGTVDEYQLVSESLLRRLVSMDGSRGRESRVQVARILGVLDRPYRNELLHCLLEDDAPQVVRAAIAAAGETRDRSFVDPLVQFLGDASFAVEARGALASFGMPIFGTLYDYLVDEEIPYTIRQNIPGVYAETANQFGATLLIRSLPKVMVPVRHAAVRALSRIHHADHFEFDDRRVDAAIDREIRHFAMLGQVLRARKEGEPGAGALEARLQDLREEALERVFRLLGLRYDQRDIYDAYLGITNPDPGVRDSAVEFVDNLVDYRTRRQLLPLLDDPEGTRAQTIGRKEFGLRIRHWDDAREALENADDPRLSGLLHQDSSDGTPVPAPADIPLSSAPPS